MASWVETEARRLAGCAESEKGCRGTQWGGCTHDVIAMGIRAGLEKAADLVTCAVAKPGELTYECRPESKCRGCQDRALIHALLTEEASRG